MHAANHLQQRLRERNWRRNKREREERSSIHGRGGCNNPVRRRTWHPQDPNSMSNVMTVESPSSSMDDDNNNKDAHKTTLISMDNRSTPSTNWTLGSSSPPPTSLLRSSPQSKITASFSNVKPHGPDTDWHNSDHGLTRMQESRALCLRLSVCACVLVRVCLCLSVEENWRCSWTVMIFNPSFFRQGALNRQIKLWDIYAWCRTTNKKRVRMVMS
jgi:hypothetical protein